MVEKSSLVTPKTISVTSMTSLVFSPPMPPFPLQVCSICFNSLFSFWFLLNLLEFLLDFSFFVEFGANVYFFSIWIQVMVKLTEFCGDSVNLRCQLPDEADAGSDCEKKEDEDDFHRRYIPKWPDPSCVPNFQSESLVHKCRRQWFFHSQRGCRFLFLSTAAIEKALLWRAGYAELSKVVLQ